MTVAGKLTLQNDLDSVTQHKDFDSVTQLSNLDSVTQHMIWTQKLTLVHSLTMLTSYLWITISLDYNGGKKLMFFYHVLLYVVEFLMNIMETNCLKQT